MEGKRLLSVPDGGSSLKNFDGTKIGSPTIDGSPSSGSFYQDSKWEFALRST